MKTNQQFDELRNALDTVIENSFLDELIAGTVVLVSYDGQPIYQRIAGYANPDKKIPMEADSLFRLASISKAFTSLAAAALLQQGKLNLDDPVTKWLPEFTPKTLDGKTPVITIKHLLTHMAGLDYGWAQISNGSYAMAGISDGLDISGITLEENLKRLASVPLFFEPGTAWQYSLAPDVLGAIIAKAHGTSFPKAMKALLTDPLGMTNTGFYASEKDRERITVPYYLDKGNLTRMQADQIVTNEDGWRFFFSPDRPFDPYEYPSGGVGMIGTGSDLMLLVEAIRKNSVPTIGEDIMKQMSANQLPEGMFADPGIGFGLGWAVVLNPAEAETPQSPGTLAWGGVYGHKWFTDPAKKLSVVTLTTTSLDEAISKGVRDAIYANLPE